MSETLDNRAFEPTVTKVLAFPASAKSGTDTATDGNQQLYTVANLQSLFGVSNKQARNYAATVKDAYPWLTDELKRGQKYTELMVEKIREFKASGLSANDWIATIHHENPDKLQPQQPEINPLAIVPSVGSTLGTFSVNHDYQNLYQSTQDQLQQQTDFEAQLNQTIEQGIALLSADNTQWNQYEMSQDELLLRQAAAEGAALALKYEQTKTQSFKSTRAKVRSCQPQKGGQANG